jgi:hypothetical protein
MVFSLKQCYLGVGICLRHNIAELLLKLALNTNQSIKRVSRASVMVLNATFNNISVISWQSVLLVEDTGVPEENHRPVASH